MCSIYKRKNGWYYAQFYDSERIPQKKQVSLKTMSRRVAQRKAAKLELLMLDRAFDPWNKQSGNTTESLRLNSATELFLKSRQNLSVQSIKKYRSVLGQLCRFLPTGVSIPDITTNDIQNFIDSADRAPTTKKTYLSTLTPLFNWAIRQGTLSASPCKWVRVPRIPETAPRSLSLEEVERICKGIRSDGSRPKVNQKAGMWLIPIVRCNVYLGLRSGELVNLQWRHICFDKRQLFVRNEQGFQTKSRRNRALPLSGTVLQLLAHLHQERRSEYVFPSAGGNQLHAQYLSRSFKRYCLRVGIEKACFHSTRHTAATLLAANGCPLESIRKYMGHSTVRVTEKYIHFGEDMVRDSIAVAFSRADEKMRRGAPSSDHWLGRPLEAQSAEV